MLESIEYSFLNRVATIEALQEFCLDAKERKAVRITVPPLFVKKAKEELGDSLVKVSTVIGYPFGWSPIEAKVAETILALVDGADGLEIVVNITALKNNDWQYLAKEINTLLTIIRKQQKEVCFVIEANLLSNEEITRCCDLYGLAGIDCIGLSTGVEKVLPSIELVNSVRRQLAEQVAIKVTGENINDSTVEAFHAAGAKRIGLIVK